MSSSMRRPAAIVLCLALLSCPHPSRAQSSPGTVAGTVVDSTEGVLPGATVFVQSADNGRQRTVVTSGTGTFRVDQLPAGLYTVTVSLSGFESFVRRDVTVVAGQTQLLAVSLAVSGLEDAVTVRGTARNYASSVAGKRMSEGIVDVFNADEIGRLPDKNIGETLNRIPGVSMLLEKGEGRFVQIRGISPRLNNVTINGVSLGNGETESGGRLVPLDVIGGELLAGAQVYKTPSADMDGQGIGGTLNLTTKQPFDFSDSITALFSTRAGIETIEAISPDDTKEVPYTWDATLAGKLAGGKLGWLGGVSFSNRMTPLLGVYFDDWRPVGLGSNTVSIPTNVKNNVTVTARERLNVNASLDYRPSASSKYFLRSFVVRWDELQLRNRFDQGLGHNLTAITGPNSGVIASNRVQVNLRSEPTIKELLAVSTGGDHRLGAWSIDYLAQRHDNSVDEPNDNWEFRSGSSTFGPDTFTVRDNGTVTITSTGRDRTDPAFQTFRRVRFFEQRTQETGWVGAANVRRDMLFGARTPGFFKIGAKYSHIDRDTARAQETWNVGTLNWSAAQDPSLTRGAFQNPIPLGAEPSIWLDYDGLTKFFQRNRNDSRFFRLDPTAQYRDDFQGDFTIREGIVAAYGMGQVSTGRFTVVGGVRVERTSVDSSAFTMVQQGSALTARPVSGEGDYTNVLPSAVVTLTLRQDLLARAGWSRTIGRPEFDAIAPRSVLNISEDPVIGTIGTLSIGNPDLKARESNNIDLSLEWYFGEGALLSAGFFRKDVTNEIIPAPTQRLTNHTFQGETFDRFDINTTINAEDSFVHGIEFTLADQFRFLPSPFNGLGFAGSLTFIDSGVEVARGDEVLTLPLLQQAKTSASATLYYQWRRLDLSGTYKYNANFLTDYGSSRAFDLDQGSFGRFDVRAQFDLTRDIKLTVSGINLNNEPTTEFQGGNSRQNTEYEYTGRTFFLGISARIGR